MFGKLKEPCNKRTGKFQKELELLMNLLHSIVEEKGRLSSELAMSDNGDESGKNYVGQRGRENGMVVRRASRCRKGSNYSSGKGVGRCNIRKEHFRKNIK